jgi:hypothetical protein
LVKVLSFGLNFGNSGDFGNSFFTQDMAAAQCTGSSVQSVVQKVFPRLPFEVFSSQIESYGQLSLHVEDRI